MPFRLRGNVYEARAFGKLLPCHYHEAAIAMEVLPSEDVPAIAAALHHIRALTDGKCLHTYIISSGLELNSLLGTLLIHMYCKWEAIPEAYACFRGDIIEENTYSWNYIIGAHSQLGQSDQTLHLYWLMLHKGILPDRVTYVQVFSSLDDPGDLHDAMQVHAQIVGGAWDSDVVICTTLVSMYGKCGNLENARSTFRKASGRNVICCNAMISACVKNSGEQEALKLFKQMQFEGALPDKATFTNMLCVFASLGSLMEANYLHSYAIRSGVASDVRVHTALISMYGKCQSIHYVKSVVDKVLHEDVITWNSLISALSSNVSVVDILKVFHDMQEHSVLPNRVTFISIVDAMVDGDDATNAKRVHTQSTCNMLDADVVLGTAIISMYGRCGCPELAVYAFEHIIGLNVVSWSVVIAMCARSGLGKKALGYFAQMISDGFVPDKFTYISVLDACASEHGLADGQLLHVHITRNQLDSDLFVANSLLNMYGKCGNLEDAWSIFMRIPVKNLVSWNTLITALSEYKQIYEALQLYDQMLYEGMCPDRVTYLSVLSDCPFLFRGKCMHVHTANKGLVSDANVAICLIDMYGKLNDLSHARMLFDCMPIKSLVAWNILFSAYSQHVDSQEILVLFEEMCQRGVIPDKFICATLVAACGSRWLLSEGKKLHFLIMSYAFELDSTVASVLMNMYGKCGSLEDACLVFSRTLMEDNIAWNTMIANYALWNRCTDAYRLYNQMQVEGRIPDKVTHINILSSCVEHSALIIGKIVHVQLLLKHFDSDVIVATALVTMYGKCGSLQNASIVFNNMDNHNVFSWNALVSSYAHHGHGKEALLLLNQMQEEGLTPDAVTLVSVVSACSHAGLIDEAYHVLADAGDYGIKLAFRHYDSFIDLIGRAGRVYEAEGLVNQMPCQPNFISWTSLIGACTNTGDTQRGEHAADHMMEIDPDEPASYVVLSKLQTVN